MNCEHVTLSKKLVGEQVWYQCPQCDEKFHAVPWDGRVALADPTSPSASSGTGGGR